jgi:hypothetical protein
VRPDRVAEEARGGTASDLGEASGARTVRADHRVELE